MRSDVVWRRRSRRRWTRTVEAADGTRRPGREVGRAPRDADGNRQKASTEAVLPDSPAMLARRRNKGKRMGSLVASNDNSNSWDMSPSGPRLRRTKALVVFGNELMTAQGEVSPKASACSRGSAPCGRSRDRDESVEAAEIASRPFKEPAPQLSS